MSREENIQSAMASEEYQERLARDIALTDRVQAGYTPLERTPKNPRPKIIDGTITNDAADALGELFINYQRLITQEASKAAKRAHNKTSLSTEDLADEGYFSVYHAAVTFDKSRGGSFTTHLYNRLSTQLKKYVETHESLVKLPRAERVLVKKYGFLTWSIYQTQERFPLRDQVAEQMGITTVRAAQLASQEALTVQMGSIDEGYYSDGRDRHTTFEKGRGKWTILGNPENIAIREVDAEATTKLMGDMIREVLKEKTDDGEISANGLEVLRLRFYGDADSDWGPLTLQEIGQRLGFTREKVRQIESRTLAILRKPGIAEKIRPFIDAA